MTTDLRTPSLIDEAALDATDANASMQYRNQQPLRNTREAFDFQWQEVLTTGDLRWFSYPEEDPATQTGLFEWVKAGRIQHLLSAHGIAKGQVLEFGCGAAGMSVFLANKGFRVHATDVSSVALEVARLNAGLRGSPATLHLLCGDAFRLPYTDGAFDVAMSYGLLEHFQQAQVSVLLTEVLRVLRPGGLFLSDIVPASRRISVRTIGLVLSYLGSLVYHLSGGQTQKARGLYPAYFRPFYENALDDRAWGTILKQAGLDSVQIEVCRPFPPLAVSGRPEWAYVQLMRLAMPLWRSFDRSNSWFSRRWGWMYLAHGIRP